MDSNLLGNRIKLLREEKNISQLELAKILNIGNTTLSQYESGKRIPSDEIKLRLAKHFGVSLDWLMGLKEERDIKTATKNKPDKVYHHLDTSGLVEEDIRKIEEYIELIKLKYNPDGTLKKG